MRKIYGSWAVLLLLLFSCGNDDSYLPAYKQDLAELLTDGSGNAAYLSMDDGRRKRIDNKVSGLVPDTLYRVLALYLESEHTVVLEGAQQVFSPQPVQEDSVELKMDPLSLKAIWKSPRYLNLLVGVKTGGGRQTLGFIDQGVELTPSGAQKLNLALYHNQFEDPEYYTQDVYLSCPLYMYERQLTPGQDSVAISVNISGRVVQHTFPY